MAKKKKYYVVWVGHEAGVYDNWADCQAQIKGYPAAKYKSFSSKAEADAAFENNYHEYMGKGKAKSSLTPEQKALIGTPVWKSIAVDAACSGNPGILEYQGVDTQTGRVLFRQGPFPHGTQNIGEFLAIVHGLAYLKQHNINLPIYSDSKIAMKWVRDKKSNTKLIKNSRNAQLFEILKRGEKWLQSNSWNNKILKWETKAWGEIPADFGRK